MSARNEQSKPVIRYLISGLLTRSTIITTDGRIRVDQLGGSALYSAGGLGMWDTSAGILATAGNDYPIEWLESLSLKGIDTHGIRITDEPMDVRHFAAYDQDGNPDKSAPVSIFLRLEAPLPYELLGYVPREIQLDSRNRPGKFTLRSADVPDEYMDATAVHFCPTDFLTHSLMPGNLRQGQIQTITVDPSPGYMNKAFWDDIPQVIAGITAFLPSEEEALSLFEGRTRDLKEIAAALAAYGCEFVIIKRGAQGVLLYEQVSRTYRVIPAYPASVIDPTGVGDAFCGGFLAGLRLKYDPFEAALMGSVSASFKIQGVGPFYPMEALPELVNARLEILREKSKIL
ncbi:MAG: carbohydrate kinase family protein [Leptolinea sp.]|jgi:sugar/nucleoside kinase (ribokinase family)|nr:carbohydrate kinase family protein [Leptolinea sp.]